MKYCLIFLIFIISSCSVDYSLYGNLKFYNQYNAKNNFRFAVYDGFLEKTKSSKIDDKFPKINITKKESRLLKKLMKTQKKCINQKGKIDFVLLRRQDRVYDMTFFDLIKENYRVRPVTPVLYFGYCIAGS